MEATDKKDKNTHHGQAIKYFSRTLGIKPDALAAKVGITPEEVKQYEASKVVEDSMIEKFANALGIPSQLIKAHEDSSLTVIVENNNVTNENNDKVVNAGYLEDNSENHFKSLDKLLEIYAQLLEGEQQRVDLLKKLLEELERKRQ